MFTSRAAAATLGVSALLAIPLPSAAAAASAELQQLKNQIADLRQSYESRLQALERRLTELQATPPAAVAQPSAPPPAADAMPAEPQRTAAGPATTGSAFNPAISLILAGTYAKLSRDPATYRLQGFVPSGGDVGPGGRSFRLGESELGISASIDPTFSGTFTASLAADNSVSVEEAWFETQGVFTGANLRGGRFLSSIGYLNSHHAHTWDFVDAPLVYQAFFGGPLKTDGLQLRWLAPTQRYLELGAEIGSGTSFPGSETGRNGIGSTALFAHLGDDLGDSASWRAGLSVLQHRARDRAYDDRNAAGTFVTNSFSGSSRTWVADGIYKWAPGGNARSRSLTVQGEYFRRTENGSLVHDTLAQAGGPASGDYRAAQSGWYLQTVYQFVPRWRVGARYDRLDAGSPRLGLVGGGGLSAADFPILQGARPSRSSLMLDFSPSEFSRLRLQLAADRSNPDATDRQIFLQYIMSLGAHGAHTF
jgi:hypothetical protein